MCVFFSYHNISLSPWHIFFSTMREGGRRKGKERESPDTNTYLRAKLKVSVFENEMFSWHLIFDKKTFFSKKKCIFNPIKKNFVFLKKKQCFSLKKKMFFWKYFFENVFFKISKTFLRTKNFSINFFNFFEKIFPKKNI